MTASRRSPSPADGGQPARTAARDRLLAAAIDLLRTNGFADTGVEALCAAAGVTKGAFFHHFATKEALGVAAAEHWAEATGAMFAAAPYHQPADPVDRVMAMIDFRIALASGSVEQFSCVAGTLVQEAFASSPAIRRACAGAILGNARALEADIAAAMAARGVTGTSAASLARHVQTVIQGSFIMAKTQEGEACAAMAREALGHLRRYFELLFHIAPDGADRKETVR